MNSKLIFSVLGLLLMTLFLSCEKEAGGDVEIYLLSDFTTVDNSFEIISGSEQVERDPLITYDDIMSYDEDAFSFELTEDGKSTILDLEYSGHSQAFAVVANGKVIYTGYFWASYSSQSCDWVVIDPSLLSLRNDIVVSLGYVSSDEIPDKRNDKNITRIFKRDNKLK